MVVALVQVVLLITWKLVSLAGAPILLELGLRSEKARPYRGTPSTVFSGRAPFFRRYFRVYSTLRA